MNNPLVSIIVPVYNVEKYIANFINSIINQTYKNYELILVNDGTKDKSIDIAIDLLKDTKVNYHIINQKNKGSALARNAGLHKAKGKWISFIDSDDYILNSFIEKLVTIGETNNCDIVISNYEETKYTNSNNRIKTPAIESYTKKEAQRLFLNRELKILVPGVLYNHDFLSNNNLVFSDIRWSEDQEFMWRVLYYANNISYTNELLYKYFRHNNSIMNSTNIERIIEGYNSIKKLDDLYNNDIGKFISSRWVMGSLNSSSRYLSFNEWICLYEKIKGKESFERLLSFPNIKVKSLAFVGILIPKVYFKTNRKNG